MKHPTRRHLLQWVGKSAGATALYQTMTALGLLHTPSAWAGPAGLQLTAGHGKTVALLGAGVSSLMAAYELQKAGYRCVILEALGRPGGRNFTARRGTRVVEDTGPQGRTEQVCQFDAGQYMNLGPARLPFQHPRLMHYCKELKVPLEVYVMSNSANLFQSDKAFGGKAVPRYRLGNDVNSHIAEMMGKASEKGALDAELSPEDRQRFMSMVRSFGGLPLDDALGSASDTPRNLCLHPMTVQAMCEPNPRLALDDMLRSGFWEHNFFQPIEGDWAPTLFQPVGGMDKLVDAFTRHVGSLIRYRAQVVQISNLDKGVQVVYRDGKSGQTHSLRADHVFSAIPLPKLAAIQNNFSADYQKALAAFPVGELYKLAWQAERRFWEEAPYNIFGGISYTDSPMTQMWYPSNDYMSKKGVIPGCYTYDAQARAFGNMSLAERIRVARRDAIKLHPEFADEKLLPASKAVSIAWHQAEGQSAGYAAWERTNPAHTAIYDRLLQPEGRFIAIGDQLSPLPGWQEGAFLSAEHAMRNMR
jgi:monoamine oxidase